VKRGDEVRSFPLFPIDPLEHGSVAGIPDDRATPREVPGALEFEKPFANAALISRNEMPEGLLEFSVSIHKGVVLHHSPDVWAG
jgi:hypothetical protein